MKKVDSWNKPPWKRNIRMKGKGVNIINTKRNSTYKPTKKKRTKTIPKRENKNTNKKIQKKNQRTRK